MSFCKKCGRQLPDNAKFCDKCGTRQEADFPTAVVVPQKKYESVLPQQTKRETVYEGTIHKCPNCGVVLESFQEKCPSCGHEIRDSVATLSVSQFFINVMNTQSEDERIRLIKMYPVPSNKEDILEFMFLASSNFDAEYYVTHKDVEDISDAWWAKIELCYKKAKYILKEADDIEKIEKIYKEAKAKLRGANLKNRKKLIIGITIICLGLLMLTLPMPFGMLSLVALVVGIVMVIPKKKTESNSAEYSYYRKAGGFSSWSGWGKFWWIVLNIYTMGIPAIIYLIARR